MAGTLTSETFAKLLASLDADRERAGEKYENLRSTLMRYFQWRGVPFPEEQTDEVFDRVARKVRDGFEIRNLGGYCYEVARLVRLEALKGNDSKRASLDTNNQAVPAVDRASEAREKELHLTCLEDCLHSLPAESSDLIIKYYQDDERGRIKRRKLLAMSLGLQGEALANRAQRVRDKLEQCVRRCLREKRR